MFSATTEAQPQVSVTHPPATGLIQTVSSAQVATAIAPLQQAQEPQVASYIAPTVTSVPAGCGTFSGPMEYVFCHESTDNSYAINPYSGACGLGQAWPCSKMPCALSDVACQINYFTEYADQRYGSWDAAAAYWAANSNW